MFYLLGLLLLWSMFYFWIWMRFSRSANYPVLVYILSHLCARWGLLASVEQVNIFRGDLFSANLVEGEDDDGVSRRIVFQIISNSTRDDALFVGLVPLARIIFDG